MQENGENSQKVVRDAQSCIRKMCEKGFIKNEDSVVSVIVEKEKCQRAESEYVVKSRFKGSLPSFITAFLGGRSLSESDAEDLKNLIDSFTDDHEDSGE